MINENDSGTENQKQFTQIGHKKTCMEKMCLIMWHYFKMEYTFFLVKVYPKKMKMLSCPKNYDLNTKHVDSEKTTTICDVKMLWY